MDHEPVDIGVVTGAHGMRGDVVIRLFNPASDLLEPGLQIVLRDAKGTRRVARVTAARSASKGWCVHLQDLDDRTAAEGMRGVVIEIARDQLPALDDGEFYYRDIVGAPVALADGTPVGTVADVFEAATDILVVRRVDGSELLVPVVEGFVLSVRPDGVVIDPSGLETD